MFRVQNVIAIPLHFPKSLPLSLQILFLAFSPRPHIISRYVTLGHNLNSFLPSPFRPFSMPSPLATSLFQRSATKVTVPLVWTNACCSHPLYRESELIEENFLGVRNAAQRKLFDELGISPEEVPVDELIPLGRILYKAPSDGKWGEHELDYLLFIVRDVKLNPNPDEVASVHYVNRDQLRELLRKAKAGEDGIKLSPWFRLVVDNFLMKWWDHVENGTLHEASDMKTIHNLS